MPFFRASLIDDISNAKQNITKTRNSVTFNYPCWNYHNCTGYEITLEKGEYLIEAWGAEGGGKNNGCTYCVTSGGKGGYSFGIINFKQRQTMYGYIGGTQVLGSGHGGFNGGGAIQRTGVLNYRGSGGGGTDLRFIKGSFITKSSFNYQSIYMGGSESLKSRFLVAGGGGGGSDNLEHGSGGNGGGYIGQSILSAIGGTQTKAGYIYNSDVCREPAAGLGYGLSCYYGGTAYYSGGGGGYYGGGIWHSSAGGSGFINKSIFVRGTIISGNEEISSSYDFKEIGHLKTGAIRITMIGTNKSCVYHNKFKTNFLHLFLIIICISIY